TIFEREPGGDDSVLPARLQSNRDAKERVLAGHQVDGASRSRHGATGLHDADLTRLIDGDLGNVEAVGEHVSASVAGRTGANPDDARFTLGTRLAARAAVVRIGFEIDAVRLAQHFATRTAANPFDTRAAVVTGIVAGPAVAAIGVGIDTCAAARDFVGVGALALAVVAGLPRRARRIASSAVQAAHV